MRRLSANAVVIAIIVAFATLGTTRFIRDFNLEDALTVRFKASFSHPILLGGTQQTAFIRIDLTGFEIERESDRTPVNVAFVLDKSGSMGGQKMEQAIEATIMAIDHLSKGDVVSLIAYDNRAHVLMPATVVADKAAIRQRIRSLVAGGGTALYAGVLQGASELREFLDPHRVNRVILLSDGQANEGPSTPSELGDLGASLIREGISVTTIGLGLGYNEDLMTQLALRSDGNHNFVANVEALATIFNQEFGDVLSVVAQDVKVTIDCEDGIRPVRVLGREAEIDGQTVTVSLNQLYSEQEKYVLLEVATEPSESGNEVEIAQVSMTYANMFTHDTDEQSATLSAQITDSEEVVKENIDKKSMVAAVQQQGILNEERAIELRDQGRKEEAEQVLRANAAFYESNAELYEDADLSSGADRSRAAIDNLEGGRWNQQRKAMRSDHYKGKVQQSNP
ncbi:MAG: VWA domain-containing protein [Rhodothermales bacterium]|nr:VWA domain-containing protein [Rhodothermales bacterium]